MMTRWSRVGGRAISFAMALAAALFFIVEPAVAKSRICRQLEAELAGGGRPVARSQKYDAAIARQREQMLIARSQAREAGCGFALFGRTVRQCAAINATVDRMVRNLEVLQRQRGGNGGVKRSIPSLLAALQANGCRDAVTVKRPTEAVEETPFADGGIEQPGDALPASGEFRTMCVRICDGYFFPMSQIASVSEFERDQKNCESACPGTDVQLFYGDSNSSEVDGMLSKTTGRRYSDLPAAFVHQNLSAVRPPGCGCGAKAKKQFEVIAGTPGRVGPSSEGEVAPAPQSAEISGPAQAQPQAPSSIIRIRLPESPKPIASNQRGVLPQTDRQDTVPPITATPPGNRKVRVVGPKFLPDPEAAAGPPAPARPQVP